SAVTLVFLVLRHVFKTWQSCQQVARRSQTEPNYLYATTAVALLLRENGPTLPRPQDLLTLLSQEETAARLALRKQANKAGSTIQLVVETANIHAQNAHVTTGPTAAPPTPKAGEEPVLKVDRWSDLAVGIDDDWVVWAMSPPPELG